MCGMLRDYRLKAVLQSLSALHLCTSAVGVAYVALVISRQHPHIRKKPVFPKRACCQRNVSYTAYYCRYIGANCVSLRLMALTTTSMIHYHSLHGYEGC